MDWFWPGFVLNNRLCDEILSWCWISFSKKVKVKLKRQAEGILCYFWHFFKNFCFWPMKRLFLNTCDFRAYPLTPLCPLYHHHVLVFVLWTVSMCFFAGLFYYILIPFRLIFQVSSVEKKGFHKVQYFLSSRIHMGKLNCSWNCLFVTSS